MPAGFPSKGENINHFAGVRLRILGTGSVKLKFLTLPNNLGIKKKVNQSKINTSIASSAAIITSASFLMVNDETVTFPNSKQTNLTGFTSGSVIFSDGASLLAEDNVNFFWDNPNNRLGLKTNVPTVTFDLFESGLITTTTIGHRLHNSTGATLAVPKRICPRLGCP